MRIVLTGGGTGGHVIPNVAVIEELKGNEILYLGSKDGVERKIIEKIGIRFEGVSCGKLRRYFSWQNFVDFFKLPIGIFQARRVLKDFKPDVIFSKGGYVSVPVVIAARRLRIPVIVHESDVSPGLANKICFRFANKICLSFEETRSYLKKKFSAKALFTGAPVRKSILKGDREAGLKFTGFDKHRPVLLVMGGSLGARQINGLLRASLDELLKKFQIVHVVGKGNLDIGVHKKGYKQYEFLDSEFPDVYAACEIVVSRAGANSLYEIALLKKRALIIPLEIHASRGEQVENARIFAKNLGWSVLTGDVSREDFINNIGMTFKNELGDFKFKNGVDEIVKLISKVAK